MKLDRLELAQRLGDFGAGRGVAVVAAHDPLELAHAAILRVADALDDLRVPFAEGVDDRAPDAGDLEVPLAAAGAALHREAELLDLAREL